jgi:uncharacterized repeat protein (TIGR03803 family)
VEYGIRVAFGTIAAAACIYAGVASADEGQVKETVLYSFSGGNDGLAPYAGLIADETGALFGTTGYSGAFQFGTVFKLVAPARGQTAWNATVLWSFTGGQDGCYPYAELLARNESPSRKKTLYGTSTGLGCGNGAVFKLTDGSLTTLWAFTGGSDGANPAGALIGDAETGALYGSTYGGGASGNGTVFKIDPVDQTLTTIWSFSGGDGANPMGRLLADDGGALYGTTYGGGAFGSGVVFKLNPPGRGQTAWSRTVLYNFCSQSNCSDGANTFTAGVIADERGALYGTTIGGGAYGGGTVFKLTPPAQGQTDWTETVLYSFCSEQNCSDGVGPEAPLTADDTGALYGTAGGGGINNFSGTVFKLTPPAYGQTAWKLTTLYAFTGGSDGAGPYAGLLADERGALYGTTVAGGNITPTQEPCGNFGCGVVFKLTGTGFATENEQ